MKIKNIAIAIVAIVIGLTTLTACNSTNNNRDLENVQNRQPDYIENIFNMDGHPNIAVICTHGIGIITTKRSGAGAIHLVPKLDSFCEGKRK